ncbi:BolA domain UV induced protein Uvi31 [Cryptotrichosporon argae]
MFVGDFAVAIVSPAFVGKSQIARHRLVNGLLKDEFERMGLHALSLRLKTPDEWEREVRQRGRAGVSGGQAGW